MNLSRRSRGSRSGDISLVKTGAKVPLWYSFNREGHINEASITESVPVSKRKDSQVYAGTILENGTIQLLLIE